MINNIKDKIQSALLNINPFTINQMDILHNVANQLNDYYKNTWLNITFDGQLIRPNEYNIEFNYLFKKEGKSKRNRPYLYDWHESGIYYINKNEIKKYNELIYNYSNVVEIKSKMILIVSKIVRELKSKEKITDIRRS